MEIMEFIDFIGVSEVGKGFESILVLYESSIY